MFDNFKNSIELKTIFFRPTSNIPIERLNQFRHVLRDFKSDWGVVLVNVYLFELKQLSNSFPELNFHVEKRQSAVSNTIFISITKRLN